MSPENTAQGSGERPAENMSANRLELRILVIRGCRVMLDGDLARIGFRGLDDRAPAGEGHGRL